MFMEQYHVPLQLLIMAEKLVKEYDRHEAQETDKEVQRCKPCPYRATCNYSIFKTIRE
jgi:hypothetical protein